MIDFVRIHYADKFKFESFILEESNFQDLYQNYNVHTSEIEYPYKTKLQNMELRITDKTGYIKGSLHKLYNHLEFGEDHNHNDFTYSNLCRIIDYLESRVIDVSLTSLTQLEFGFNLSYDKPAQDFIKENLIMYKFKNHNHDNSFQGKGKLKQFDATNYFIKIYDKAMQYKQDHNILRVELKMTRRREFNSLGIFNLSDLKDKNKLRKLFFELRRKIKEFTIVDNFPSNTNFEKNDKELLLRYINPNYWELEISKMSAQSKLRHKRKFNSLLRKYNLDNTHQLLIAQVREKFIYLINN